MKISIRPIVSNINTPTYQLAKYLVKLLSSLSQSDYTVYSTKHFIEQIKYDKIPEENQMMSFNVRSLFKSMLLSKTIEIILGRIYDRTEINAYIPKTIMKEILLLCTKDFHFLYEDEIYQQTDGVGMESLLRPILASISLVEIEPTIVPTLGNLLRAWKRYVDDTFCIDKTDSVSKDLLKLNSFHINIQFTYETESHNLLTFLDILVIHKNNSIETTVYRKPTNNKIYLNWNSFSPKP